MIIFFYMCNIMIKYVLNLFFKHPNENGLTYLQHFFVSFVLAKTFMIASIFALIHAVFPFMYETSSTDTLKYLNDFIEKHRKKSKE